MLRGMYDPSMRVLTVLELLGARGRMSGADLAATMEVSVRTVQRYVARLQDLGIPVEGTRGPGGFYRLKPGFRLPPLMFGSDEALALTLGLGALTFLGLDDVAPATAGAAAKLGRVLPEAISAQVGVLRAVLELERPCWVVGTNVTLLTRLAAAVHGCHRVSLSYADRGGAVSERVLEPFGVMQQSGRWFLAGYCHLREGLRLFRVDRVVSVTVLQETFTHPSDFEMAAFLRDSLAFAPEPWQVEVWLELPPETAEGQLPGIRAVLEAQADGTLLRCGADDLELLALRLLMLGCRLEVKRPPELAAAFGVVAERAACVVAANA